MSDIFHVTTQLGRMDSFFLEADTKEDIDSLLSEISEADIINIKKIIYSKRFKIATSESESPYPSNEDTIYKWSFFCYSNNHSKQIDFYNIKPHTTKEDLEKFLKTQLILDEPIIGFYDDVRNDFNMIRLFDDNLFQVVYKYNSRTYTENFYSNNIPELMRFFDSHIGGEVIEIREFVMSSLSNKLDDGNYYKRISLTIKDDNLQFKTFIPNIKRTKNLNTIKELILLKLKFRNRMINDDELNMFLKS